MHQFDFTDVDKIPSWFLDTKKYPQKIQVSSKARFKAYLAAAQLRKEQEEREKEEQQAEEGAKQEEEEREGEGEGEGGAGKAGGEEPGGC